jgi:hypothetical protein
MALKINPKREEELSKGGFENLPPGEYPFTVMESGIAQSKSQKNLGREMCAVKILVHGKDFDKHIYDYFADWFSEWKLKHFCEVVGPDDDGWRDRQGFVKIKVTPANGNYEAKNEVVDYLPDEGQKVEALGAAPKPVAEKPAQTNAQPPEDDSVPF